MAKLVIAKSLGGKRVITNDGEEIGKLIDVSIQDTTGKIEDIVIEPNPDSRVAQSLTGDDGYVCVPFLSVIAVSDYVVVERKSISGSSSGILEYGAGTGGGYGYAGGNR
ncbi:PRC-barrel domain-containing protein [Candidatus Micrarchaeota archaeon]|jgi:sporulation protein YlmC with PRC-barrel domain|nr:PRC-barrel domain-containing protein [Candidatus Micrarchaeota archaeon]